MTATERPERLSEVIYNLFAYTDGRVITDLCIAPYRIVDKGTDDEKLGFLRERCLIDHADAYKARVVSPRNNAAAFHAKHRLGGVLDLFEELFRHVNAPPDLLFCMTTIENGEARIDHSHTGSLDPSVMDGRGKMIDYLDH